MAYGLKLSKSIQILGFNVLIILFTLSGVTGDRKSGLLYFFTKKKCKIICMFQMFGGVIPKSANNFVLNLGQQKIMC